MARARAWPSVVLPTPGTPSISRWPLAKMETRARRRTSSLPRMTVRSDCSSRAARVDETLAAGVDIASILLCELRAEGLLESCANMRFPAVEQEVGVLRLRRYFTS